MIESVNQFIRLRCSEDPADYARAGSEEASLEVWLGVIAKHPEMREWVAHNKSVPLEVLALLAQDSDSRVRATVASKRKLDLSLQSELAGDADETVRYSLACNAKCDRQVLAILSSDPVAFVRDAAQKKLRARKNAI